MAIMRPPINTPKGNTYKLKIGAKAICLGQLRLGGRGKAQPLYASRRLCNTGSVYPLGCKVPSNTKSQAARKA